MDTKGKVGTGTGKTDAIDFCARFLGKLGETRGPDKRLSILKACARLERPWIEELFWRSLADPCEYVRDFLIRELIAFKEVKREHAVEMLTRPPWYARCAILKVAAGRKMADLVPYLASLVNDPNIELKRAVADTLGAIGGESALRLLISLRKDTNPLVRMAAEKAIADASGLRFT